MIDFMLCLVAFLLVTAVWSRLARLRADALVPGAGTTATELLPTVLHVAVTSDAFVLNWKQGSTLLESTHVEKRAFTLPDGSLRYPELVRAAGEQWREHGAHRAATDAVQDRAVLHTPNTTEFREVTAVLDALHAPKRAFEQGRRAREIPVYNVAFATD